MTTTPSALELLREDRDQPLTIEKIARTGGGLADDSLQPHRQQGPDVDHSGRFLAADPTETLVACVRDAVESGAMPRSVDARKLGEVMATGPFRRHPPVGGRTPERPGPSCARDVVDVAFSAGQHQSWSGAHSGAAHPRSGAVLRLLGGRDLLDPVEDQARHLADELGPVQRMISVGK